MKCPFCENEMEEGAIISQRVPKWLNKDEKKGVYLSVKKHLSYNEISGFCCKKCGKIVINL